jgi:hypothetical protein
MRAKRVPRRSLMLGHSHIPLDSLTFFVTMRHASFAAAAGDVPRDVTLDQPKTAIKGHQTGQRGVMVVRCCTNSK